MEVIVTICVAGALTCDVGKLVHSDIGHVMHKCLGHRAPQQRDHHKHPKLVLLRSAERKVNLCKLVPAKRISYSAAASSGMLDTFQAARSARRVQKQIFKHQQTAASKTVGA